MTTRCDSHAPVRARMCLAELPDLDSVLGDAMLVVSELVTNAVRHSLCSEDDELTVSVQCLDAHVRLSVRDPGVSGRAAKIAEDHPWFGGLGLRIVEQLSTRWGSQRDAEGHEVWAELPLVAPRQTSVAPAHPRARSRPRHSRPRRRTSRPRRARGSAR